MKRDMDLVRAILQKVASCDSPDGLQEEIQINGYAEKEIFYHIKILHEAGLLDAIDVSEGGEDGFCWWPGNLTWNGQDFIDLAKDSVWSKAKESILKPGVSFTFDLLFSYLKQKAAEKLGLSVG